ncbi:isocitrate lyase/phosphoenolpyruvate mutase family protein [Streptomyces sp. NRRL B-24484]|uniref:isocitrate lyase/phosphoenolpyruvate mutase family protein n=1 Tax=Streptomyces sp. NRRL B-24484 TaxID=1463833 RepID=UPI0004C19F2B|nr:isocitrate lyase/phosphoenolpyruvate mutase family protein [Streptomyces sp. NRRL B-24484]
MTTNPLKAALTAATASRTLLRAMGAANAMAATVAAEAGFDALWVSGLEVSTALGLPDENVLGPRDLADVVVTLGRVCDLPVIVDVDNAGGSAATARRFGTDLARAGASALCLEDSVYPKVNSFALHRGQQLVDAQLMREQIKALRDAAPGVVLIARTEAMICGGTVADALERAAGYVEAGADAVLMHSKDTTGQQALDTAAAWHGLGPLVTVPTAFPGLTGEQLATAGFALAIYANQLSRASLAAMQATAASFTAHGTFTAPGAPPLADVQALLRIADRSATACL